MTATLYITRHGQTQWNVEGRMQGSLDSPLTGEGVRQAQALADRMAGVPLDAIYSSPTPRSWATAETLRGVRDLPLHAEARIREICMGAWEGQRDDALKADHPEQFGAFWKTPHLYVPWEGAVPRTRADSRRTTRRF